MDITQECETSTLKHAAALHEALRWALEWIDAVPQDVTLPAMPGFDRDYVNELLSRPIAKPAQTKDEPDCCELPDVAAIVDKYLTHGVLGDMPNHRKKLLQLAYEAAGVAHSARMKPVAWMRDNRKECTTALSKTWMETAGFGHWAEVAASYTIPLYTVPLLHGDTPAAPHG